MAILLILTKKLSEKLLDSHVIEFIVKGIGFGVYGKLTYFLEIIYRCNVTKCICFRYKVPIRKGLLFIMNVLTKQAKRPPYIGNIGHAIAMRILSSFRCRSMTSDGLSTVGQFEHTNNIVSQEPEGHYQYWQMFR